MKQSLKHAALAALCLLPFMSSINAESLFGDQVNKSKESMNQKMTSTKSGFMGKLGGSTDSQKGSESSASNSENLPNLTDKFSSATNPQNVSNVASELPINKTRFMAELQTGTQSIGTLDGLVPFLGNDDLMIYTDLIGRITLNNTTEGNFGLGFRRVNDEESAIFGMYAFYDVLRAANNNTFTQVTVGAEHLGLVWDFRGNVYLPVGKQSYQTTVYTSDALQTVNESAQMGGDLEMGHTVGSNQLRAYLGAYTFGSDLTGPRIRAEYKYNARLTLTALAQYDQARGAQYLVGMRFFMGGAKATQTDSIYSRMTDVVIRDPDIVTQQTFGDLP